VLVVEVVVKGKDKISVTAITNLCFECLILSNN
jgi:hypothetical protein